jgi:hypothetical protein
MATANDIKPCDALALLCGCYEALCSVLWEYLGHDSAALPLLQALNDEFNRILSDLDQRGMLS